MSIADNIEFLNRLPKMADLTGALPQNRLQRIDDFGANAGQLRMWCYVPPGLPANSPLVVVLHGCTQTAAAYDHGSGWSTLADRYGFAVLFPEQRRRNNPNLCFNWFDLHKTARGNGEVLSIHRMIATMVRLHRVSVAQIYVTGLSAGGAMASAMLAAYPEVFAGGAIIAGLPHGVATNLREALSAMASAPHHSAAELGDWVREASSHQGKWPKISVWHGGADRTVHPANADQIVSQWLDVHGLKDASATQSVVDGHRKQAWSVDGTTVVEAHLISGMAHGVPLGLTARDEPVGAVGPFMLEAGVDSTRQIADFFGLTASRREVPVQPNSESPAPEIEKQADVGRGPIDIAGIINRALTAAGLK